MLLAYLGAANILRYLPHPLPAWVRGSSDLKTKYVISAAPAITVESNGYKVVTVQILVQNIYKQKFSGMTSVTRSNSNGS